MREKQPKTSTLYFILAKRFVLVTVFLSLLSTISAADASTAKLDSLYRCLDSAIDSSTVYINIRQERIDRLCQKLKEQHEDVGKFQTMYSLYEEYRSFKNDSAVAYLNRCINEANRMGDNKRETLCRVRLAFQCSTTGMYIEALELLDGIDTTSLDRDILCNYLVARHHLFREMSYYTVVPWLKKKYEEEASRLQTAVFNRLNPDDDKYLLLRQMEYYEKGDYDNAIKTNDRWLSLVERGTHRYAIVAFYRFLAYDKTVQWKDEAMAWLAESALSDVRNAVMDQGSLWELANRLSTNPDELERSYKYISFAWTSAQTFNTRIRSNQISPVLQLIEGNYRNHTAKVNTQLRIIVIVVCLLLVIVVVLLACVYQQRNRLQTARNELDVSNRELKELNHRLSEYSERLKAINMSLDDSNRMKEMYIGRFLSLCSTYIANMEALCRNIQTRVKNKDYAGLVRLAQAKTGELEGLHHNFDSAFLKLFPNFVDDFNALLRPEERITAKPDGSLGTPVRIFALIRLGIDDSSRIAEFLHYSVNTIYNYRAKVKNGALGDRNDFERKVKRIGMKDVSSPVARS